MKRDGFERLRAEVKTKLAEVKLLNERLGKERASQGAEGAKDIEVEFSDKMDDCLQFMRGNYTMIVDSKQ